MVDKALLDNIEQVERQIKEIEASLKKADMQLNSLLKQAGEQAAFGYWGIRNGDVVDVVEESGRTFRMKITSIMGQRQIPDATPFVSGINVKKDGTEGLRLEQVEDGNPEFTVVVVTTHYPYRANKPASLPLP